MLLPAARLSARLLAVNGTKDAAPSIKLLSKGTDGIGLLYEPLVLGGLA